MIKITRLGHVELAVRDLDALAEHHRDVLGLAEVDRDDGTVYLATGSKHHSVALRRGDEEGIRHVAFGLDPDLSLAAAREDLAGKGVRAELKSHSEPHVAELLEFRDPEGNLLQLYHELDGEHGGPASGPTEIRPQKLGHVCLRAGDVPTLADWYQEILGFRWSDWIGDFFVFLRCGPDHHVLNLLEGDHPGVLHHIAYELRDWGEIQPAVDALARNGNQMIWGPGRHGAGHNIYTYHHDPAGNMVELFTQLDVMDEVLGCFEPRPWHHDRPQRPKRWDPKDPLGPNQWGILPPEGFA